jgi:hypothetical protein
VPPRVRPHLPRPRPLPRAAPRGCGRHRVLLAGAAVDPGAVRLRNAQPPLLRERRPARLGGDHAGPAVAGDMAGANPRRPAGGAAGVAPHRHRRRRQRARREGGSRPAGRRQCQRRVRRFLPRPGPKSS